MTDLTLTTYFILLVPSLILLGAIAFSIIADYDRDYKLEEEIRKAQEIIDMEERRFRVGEINRRNLQQ